MEGDHVDNARDHPGRREPTGLTRQSEHPERRIAHLDVRESEEQADRGG